LIYIDIQKLMGFLFARAEHWATNSTKVPRGYSAALKPPRFYDTIARLVGSRCGGDLQSSAEVAKLVDALDLGSSV
jgi:hypothetical protein